jgi:hypothetical protein
LVLCIAVKAGSSAKIADDESVPVACACMPA